MNWIERFHFLEDTREWFCYEIDRQGDQSVYKYKCPQKEGYRVLLGIPLKSNSKKNFWYKYFIKGNRLSYSTQVPVDELPEEIKDIVIRSKQIIDEQRQLRRLFK